MIVYQNRLISLNYMEEPDILLVTWSNMKPYSSEEVHYTIEKVMETIKIHNCKKILIDASVANMTMDREAFGKALTEFVSALSHTSIRKLARIITGNLDRENKIQEIKSKMKLPFQFYDISNREQALKWLIED